MRHYVAIISHRERSCSAEVQRCADFQKKLAEVFCGIESRGDVVSTGETALSNLYIAQTGEGLNALNFRPFYEMVSKSNTTAQLHSLPPT